jgi:hypothetical protein
MVFHERAVGPLRDRASWVGVAANSGFDLLPKVHLQAHLTLIEGDLGSFMTSWNLNQTDSFKRLGMSR